MTFHVPTQRFILREFRREDAKALLLMESDPDVLKYIGTPILSTIEDILPVIAHVQQQYQDHGIGRWIVEDKHSGEVVGWSGLKYEQEIRPEKSYYDVGYRLIKKYWGQGIATETALASLAYGFEQMNLTEIHAAAHVENIASNKVLQKIGMSWEETFEFEEKPHHWYRIERKDWRSHSSK